MKQVNFALKPVFYVCLFFLLGLMSNSVIGQSLKVPCINPFQVMTDNDDIDYTTPIISTIDEIDLTVIISSNVASYFNNNGNGNQSIIPSCEWPIYAYAYYGNHMFNSLGISAPLDFEPTCDENIYQEIIKLPIDFTPYTSDICQNGSIFNFTVILAFINDRGKVEPLPFCLDFYPAEDFNNGDMNISSGDDLRITISRERSSTFCINGNSLQAENSIEKTKEFVSQKNSSEDTNLNSALTFNNEAAPSTNTVTPNPFSNDLLIRLPENEMQKIRAIQLMDLNGKIWIQKKYSNQNDSFDLNWTTDHLPPGIYLLKVEGTEGIQTQKLIKY